MKKLQLFTLFIIIAALTACGNAARKSNTTDAPQQQLVGPTFQADSAYLYCEQQCQFGPRTMNSEAHERCSDWIAAKFRDFGMQVVLQQATLKGYDGTPLNATNIIASYRPELADRILLCAHWDSRPWADNDPDEANWHKPVMAANDGASGVAVMLETARLLGQADSLKIGVDSTATHGPWAHSTGRPIPTMPTTGHATAYCSTWWADRAPASIARPTRCAMPIRWWTACGRPHRWWA